VSEKGVLIGAGGHGKVVLDCLRTGHYFLDRDWVIIDPGLESGHDFFGVNVIGGEERVWLPQLAGGYFIIGLGQPLARRRELFEAAVAAGVKPHRAIKHPSAIISAHASVGGGSFVGPNAVVNCGTKVGQNVIVNTGAIVEHDCLVGDHSHVAPGAVLCGGVTLLEEVLVGANAVVLPGTIVPRGATVPAGSRWPGEPSKREHGISGTKIRQEG